MHLARSFCDAVSMGDGNGPDFYKMLWIAHWAIENYGWQKTRQTLEEIMLLPDFKPQRAPTLLRDKLMTRQIYDDCMEEWFKKAISA